MVGRWCGCWRHDPGPCPVDDTPHTACTPESVAAQAAHTAQQIVRRPRVFDRAAASTTEFSTKTYRRAVHGRGRKRVTR